MDFLERPNNNI